MTNKISTPLTDDIIPRQNLFSRLDEISRTSAVWLSGPAGAGKSTLMAGYLRDRQIPHIWYRIDHRDSDPATFFYYLGLAVEKILPQGNSSLPLFMPEYQMDVATFAARYFENLKKRTTRPFWIILDNYQDLPAASPLHEMIKLIIKLFSPDPGITIISRKDMPKSMARLLANRNIKPLGWPETAFSIEEFRNVARLLFRKKISDGQIMTLHQYTRGWIAGLILWFQQAAHEDLPVPLCFLDQTPSFIVDYFCSELLDHIDPPTRLFLLKTSFLPEMTVSAANKLTGQKSGAKILEDLRRQNFFIVLHPHNEPRYEYHPLFSSFLRSQASGFFSTRQLAQIQYKAAVVALESGLPESAAELFSQCRAWEKLSELIQVQGPLLFFQGRTLTLSKWLNYLPEKKIRQTPWLIFWKGLGLLPQTPLKGRINCEAAFAEFKKTDDSFGQVLSLAAIVESFFIVRGNMKALDKWIIEGERLADEIDLTQANEISCRFVSGILGALAIRGLNHPSLPAWMNRCTNLLGQTAEFNLQVILANFLVLIYCWQGETARADSILKKIRPSVSHGDLSPLSLIQFKIMECVFCLACGENGRCRAVAQEAMSLAENKGVRVFDGLLASYGVYGSLASGDMTQARRYLQKMAGHLSPEASLDIAHYHIFRAWESYADGHLDAALDQLKTALDMGKENGAPVVTILNAQLLAARVLLSSGKTDPALQRLTCCMGQSRRSGCPLLEFQEQMTSALFYFSRNKDAQGRTCLSTAFQLSLKQCILDGYWWQRPLLADLCEKALEADIEPDQVRLFISRHGLEPKNPGLTGPWWPWPIRIRTLGRFEIFCRDLPLVFSAKSPKKPLELMLFLICQGSGGVSAGVIMDELWPDADGDRARQNLNTTLHRLRKLLGNDRAVVMEKGRLMLAQTLCRVDAWYFKSLAGQNPEDSDPEKRISILKKILAVYSGHFDTSFAESHWAIAYAEKIRNLWIHTVIRTGRELSAAGQFKEAGEIFRKGLILDDTAEPLYQGLIRSLVSQGLAAEALMTFNRCRNTLAARFGKNPQKETLALHEELQHSRPSRKMIK